MKELIEAAKAVIECFYDTDTPPATRVDALRALDTTVEQAEKAEKQEDIVFYEWLKSWHKANKYEGRPLAPSEKTIWTAAQQAERERWIKAVKLMEEEHAYRYLDELLEKIDADNTN